MEAAPAQRQHHHLHRHSHQQQPQQHHPPGRACPRCDSTHTKFCYYNNYSLSQPRYFCKGCRRYWTHGGALRNVPVGGGSRKRPRPIPTPPPVFNHSSTSAPTLLPPTSTAPCYFPFHGGGFFSSLVALQSMNLPAPGIGAFPGTLPSSNLGNFFNGFEFGMFDRPDAAVGGWQNGLIGVDVSGFEQKPSVSAELMSPVTGDCAWSTVRGREDSALKADQWTDFLGGEGDDTDK